MGEKKQTNVTGTVYDDVYRTLIVDCPSLIIPVVNEVFCQNLPKDIGVVALENEVFVRNQDDKTVKRITDSNLLIGSKHYHFECQSTLDNTILIRFFEYDSQIALRHSVLNEHELTVDFPNAAVLYLRHNKKTPDYLTITIKVPGDKCSYSIPVMKASSYSIEEIFEKKLYFLIPFHIFSYESEFEECDTNEEKMKILTQVYSKIMKHLEQVTEQREISEYVKQVIVSMSKQVLEKIAVKYENIKKGLGDAMGGKVLEYEAKDILRQGIAQGLLEGEKRNLLGLIKKKLAKGKDILQIADELEETEEVIRKLMEELE